MNRFQSGRLDSNQRPLAPHASALPGCATSRSIQKQKEKQKEKECEFALHSVSRFVSGVQI
jgi:hypothetical protein